MLEFHFSWQAQHVVMLQWAGAAFSDVGVSLFVADAAFGDVAVSLFVAGAAFGDVGASLFVPGTVFGEIWVDSRSATCCNFPYAEARKVTSANGRISDHARIVPAL